jgi:hypothetical protein
MPARVVSRQARIIRICKIAAQPEAGSDGVRGILCLFAVNIFSLIRVLAWM